MRELNKKANGKDFSKKEKLEAWNSKIKRKVKKTVTAISSLMFLGLASYLYVNNPDFFEIKNKNACRIGITMDLERRKKEWERRYLTEGKVIKNWTVLSVHQSKFSAQEVETKEAKKQNCEAHPGGRGSEKATWYVYKIEY